MIAPHVAWSVALVVLVCSLGGVRAGGAVGSASRRTSGVVWAASAVLLLAMVAGADALAGALAVTPPTVRLSAGVAVGVHAVAAVLARPVDPSAPRSLGAGRWSMPVSAALLGPLRVESFAALWAVTLDHGRPAGVVSALLGVAAGASAADRTSAAGRKLAGRGLGTAALCVAVVVAVHGILGL